MTKKHTLTLYRTEKGWICETSDPAAFELFGTSAIPTAFTKHAKAADVLETIQRLNPDCEVKLWPTWECVETSV